MALFLFIQSVAEILIMQEDIRYIENPFEKIISIIKPDEGKLYPLLFNLTQEFIQGSRVPTLLSVASVPEETEIDTSAYSGANGYLYTLIRLYQYHSGLSQLLLLPEDVEKLD